MHYFSNMSFSSLLLISPIALQVSAHLHDFSSSFTSACAAVSKEITVLNPNVTVNFAQYVAAGTNISLADNPPSCAKYSQVTSMDICRIAMSVATSNSSQITMEAWLPRNWTGRFMSGGNGGLNGCIDYAAIAYASGFGFASVAANNGHNGTSGAPFYMHPESVADFAYRSVHTGVIVGKQLTRAFFGKRNFKSYYLGCSTGGREGFKEAQDFPDDFDGIVAGAPAIDFNHLNAFSNHFFGILGTNTSATYLTPALWAAVHAEVLKQCDGLDGAVDGIIEDPELCYFRPEALICAANQTSSCLTGVQAAAVRKVYEPLYGINGTLLYPRMQPGGEIISAGLLYNGGDFSYATDWYKYVISGPNFTYANFTPAYIAYVDSLDATLGYNISTWKGDLTAFSSRGGKILTYHGQQDFLISSANSPRYYNHVAATMNLTSAAMDDFYRFFRVSGMGHCTGGPGAWGIGQTAAGSAGASPEDNVLMSMVAWVEKGQAPEYIRGTKFVNDTAALGVSFTRKHCKYPARNVYVGPGNSTDEQAWRCVQDSF